MDVKALHPSCYILRTQFKKGRVLYAPPRCTIDAPQKVVLAPKARPSAGTPNLGGGPNTLGRMARKLDKNNAAPGRRLHPAPSVSSHTPARRDTYPEPLTRPRLPRSPNLRSAYWVAPGGQAGLRERAPAHRTFGQRKGRNLGRWARKERSPWALAWMGMTG